ncbi:pyruvate kinase [Paenibacillus phyllosphaerae]|uniref:Pyruvate kinase n=1 Tax=Paenibacillus phyllosphaerae TaxID=274593 RepID=A0A7W5B1F2_9BACL|nr:pyruvate kinase [Paenibacillus phyllosphaerae]MBB3112638.1 pyruvate kinase [Paenibacillus phyllosphaerae]
MKKTQIVCTMGPACLSADMLENMIGAGMNIARLNLAHGELDDHKERIEMVRAAASKLGVTIEVMLDIKGPEIRTGNLAEPAYQLQSGETLTLTTEQIAGTIDRISVSYDLSKDVKVGSRIMIDDGLIELVVERIEGTDVVCKIVNGGVIKSRKGVNLPGIRTSLPGVTERDKMHIAFGIENNVDMIAMSFVRRAEDVREVKQMLADKGASHIKVMSKIENQEGLDELEAIIEASDSIMVARGDLGVEIPIEDVPVAQKRMIAACNKAGKFVVTATQMLESMQVQPRPTRAEAGDVANAVWDGTDAVMLSGETAAGKYPLEAVRTMAAIAIRAEQEVAASQKQAVLA